MRVAALYDIHGNLPALEAVLAEVPDGAAGPDVESRTTTYDTQATVEAARVVPDVRPFARRLLETPSYEERAASLEASR